MSNERRYEKRKEKPGSLLSALSVSLFSGSIASRGVFKVIFYEWFSTFGHFRLSNAVRKVFLKFVPSVLFLGCLRGPRKPENEKKGLHVEICERFIKNHRF